ncbi:MAG: hypothetical protein RR054_00485 [Clostridia bacterium]
MTNKLRLFLIFALTICLCLLLLFPTLFTKAALSGIQVWSAFVLPALFPFMVLSKILLNLNAATVFTPLLSPIMKKCFKTPAIAGYAFIFGTLSGYPLGSKIIGQLYSKKAISSIDCKKMFLFCSNCGPIFIISTVATFINNSSVAIIIYFSQLLSALLCAIVYCNICDIKQSPIANSFHNEKPNLNLLMAIQDSILSVLTVGGYITIFYIISEMFALLPFSANILMVIKCALELTFGCKTAASLPIHFAAPIIAAITSFGGLCILMQCYGFLSNCKISFFFMLFSKLIQAIIAFVLCFFFMRLFY